MAESSNKCPIEAFNSSKHAFDWKIQRISELRGNSIAGRYYSIQSSVFEATLSDEAKTMTKWFLMLTPCYQGFFEVKLVKLSDVHVDFTASISVMGSCRFGCEKSIVEKKLFVERKCYLKNELLGDSPTLVCDIEIVVAASMSSMIHHKQFIKDLDHLFLDQTNNYDVTLKGVLLPQGDTFSKISCV